MNRSPFFVLILILVGCIPEDSNTLKQDEATIFGKWESPCNVVEATSSRAGYFTKSVITISTSSFVEKTTRYSGSECTNPIQSYEYFPSHTFLESREIEQAGHGKFTAETIKLVHDKYILTPLTPEATAIQNERLINYPNSKICDVIEWKTDVGQTCPYASGLVTEDILTIHIFYILQGNELYFNTDRKKDGNGIQIEIIDFDNFWTRQ